ncbi:MAG: hypothetical protein ABW220_14285 [Burkholderiaceae bacterium]
MTTYPWRFFRAGGTDQVLIETAEDIQHLRDLDQKRWVALACPTRGLEFDERTLDLIDTDDDARIRAPELIDACEWAFARLKSTDALLRGDARLSLGALADTEAGRALEAAARRTLDRWHEDGHSDNGVDDIGLEEIRERQKHLASERFNGDGVLPLTVFTDDPDRALSKLIHEVEGGHLDASGEVGIAEIHIKGFFEHAQALLAWHERGESDCGTLRPAALAVQAVHDKVEDFFARCRLAHYDPAAAAPLNTPDADRLKAAATQLLSLESDVLKQLPAAPVGPGACLPLDDRVNPAWREAFATLREVAVVPLLGKTEPVLDEVEWQTLKACVHACRDWLRERPTGKVADKGVKAIRAAVGDDPAATRDRLLALVAQDKDAAPQHAALNDLEKLVRLQRDLRKLLRNFVSFESFYRREGAIFQAGTLYLDGRACELTVEVADPAKHAVIAGLAKAFLAYCECTRQGKKKHIVAVVSAGDVDFLFIGRNGVFYDRQGHDWDARIVKMIENPISVGQAFLSPYKKLVRLIEEQVAKRAAAGDNTQQARMNTLAGKVATVDQSAAAAPATTPAAAPVAGAPAGPTAPPVLPGMGQRRVDVGTVAALGVALGSISTVIVGVFGRFIDLGWWIPVALLGIVISISGPSMLIAWLKLRQRSLGPILDASGWAINSRMRVSVRQGDSLTQRPQPVPRALRKAEPKVQTRDDVPRDPTLAR